MQTNIEGTYLGTVHCYNPEFRSYSLGSTLRLLRGVGWCKFFCGFVFLVRKK